MNIFILVIILLLLSFKSFFDYKVKKQRDALAKKVILEEERTRIAMDLHDDIGGNLTALSLMSALLKEKEIDAEGKILIDKIAEATDQMVNEMNEIVWALNVSNDYLSSTIYYIRQHASKLFFESGIAFDVTEPQEYAKVTVGGKIRRNIVLITKEIFNNIIKYASS